MFAQAHFPQLLTPQDIDYYLEKGWFRMGQTIFTTNFLNFKDRFYSAIWLRVILDEYSEDKTQQKLFRQNAGFRVEIGPAQLNTQKESLYEKYRQALAFEPSASLHSLLMGKSESESIYNTLEICLYDNSKLIAIGYFDLGSTSGMGITSVYDPDYKKYSLGKYLIYLKMNYCKQRKLRYFYPGYFVPGYSFFDYKLTIGTSALEFLQLRSDQWLRIKDFTPLDVPLEMIEEKLLTLKVLLEKNNVESHVMRYDFFDANLVQSLSGAELFDSPVFLKNSKPSGDLIDPIVVFDVRDGQYHFLKCFSVWAPPQQELRPGFYAEHVLKTEEDLFSTRKTDEMMIILKTVWSNI